MKNVMKNVVGVALVAVTTFVGMDYALSIPDVMFSYQTRECVTVANYEGVFFGKNVYSCETLPSKFNHVWVK